MKLDCPACGSENTKVVSIDYRETKRDEHIARYWRCKDCQHKYLTRERREERIRKNQGKFKLNDHQVQQIGFNIYGLSQAEWAVIYEVSQTTIQNAKERFLRKNL